MDPYYKSQEFLEILAKYEDMRDNGGSDFLDAADYADVGEYYLAQGDDVRAREAVTTALEIFPDSLPPLAVLARIEIAHGRVKEAEEIINRAEYTDDLEYHYVLAEISIGYGDCVGADRYLENLDIGDEDPDEVALDVAALFMDHYDYRLAKKWLDKVKDRSKHDVKDFEALILNGLGEFAASEKKYNELLDEDPYSVERWNHLASLQYEKGDYPASLESSEFSLALDPKNVEAVLNKANCFYALKNYEKAIIFYERFLEYRPENVVGQYYFALSYLLMHRYEESMRPFRVAYDLALQGSINTDSVSRDYLIDIVHDMTYVMRKLDRIDDIQRLLDHAIATVSNIPDMEQYVADLYLCKGKHYFLSDDGEQAVNSFEKARDAYNDENTFVRMTAILYECGYPERAYEMLGAQLFSDTGHNWQHGHAHMARYAYYLGRTDIFQQMLAIAVERDPIEARNVLGDLFPPGTPIKDYPTTPPIVSSEDMRNQEEP